GPMTFDEQMSSWMSDLWFLVPDENAANRRDLVVKNNIPVGLFQGKRLIPSPVRPAAPAGARRGNAKAWPPQPIREVRPGTPACVPPRLNGFVRASAGGGGSRRSDYWPLHAASRRPGARRSAHEKARLGLRAGFLRVDKRRFQWRHGGITTQPDLCPEAVPMR